MEFDHHMEKWIQQAIRRTVGRIADRMDGRFVRHVGRLGCCHETFTAQSAHFDDVNSSHKTDRNGYKAKRGIMASSR